MVGVLCCAVSMLGGWNAVLCRCVYARGWECYAVSMLGVGMLFCVYARGGSIMLCCVYARCLEYYAVLCRCVYARRLECYAVCIVGLATFVWCSIEAEVEWE